MVFKKGENKGNKWGQLVKHRNSLFQRGNTIGRLAENRYTFEKGNKLNKFQKGNKIGNRFQKGNNFWKLKEEKIRNESRALWCKMNTPWKGRRKSFEYLLTDLEKIFTTMFGTEVLSTWDVQKRLEYLNPQRYAVMEIHQLTTALTLLSKRGIIERKPGGRYMMWSAKMNVENREESGQ